MDPLSFYFICQQYKNNLIVVLTIAVLKSPKNVKKKKDWANKYAITKNRIYFNYRFKVNTKKKKNFNDFWISIFPKINHLN